MWLLAFQWVKREQNPRDTAPLIFTSDTSDKEI